MRKRNRQDQLRQQYAEVEPLYSDFAETVAGLLDRLLKAAQVNVHSITARVKKPESLLRKAEVREGKYQVVTDVTDLAGARIITYFADEVDTVANILQQEFSLDSSNSVDKRAVLDPDQFGYISLHYVARLSDQRQTLTEYQRFANCEIEIQIRSILQHAWAEIEHDLGYKSESAIPRELRRRFSRLAGLLEIADSEFEFIRNALLHYEESVVQRIETAPNTVSLDQASLKAFLAENQVVNAIIDRIDEDSGCKVLTELGDPVIGSLIPVFEATGIYTIAELNSAVVQNKDILEQFALHDLLKTDGVAGIVPSYPLLMLAYLLAAQSDGEKGLAKVDDLLNQDAPDDLITKSRSQMWESYRETTDKT